MKCVGGMINTDTSTENMFALKLRMWRVDETMNNWHRMGARIRNSEKQFMPNCVKWK